MLPLPVETLLLRQILQLGLPQLRPRAMPPWLNPRARPPLLQAPSLPLRKKTRSQADVATSLDSLIPRASSRARPHVAARIHAESKAATTQRLMYAPRSVAIVVASKVPPDRAAR